MLIQEIESHIREILRDIDEDQYTSEFIYSAILSAELSIHSYRPDATSTELDVVCVQGSRQSLPTTATQLLSVVRNGSPSSVGRVIHRVSETSLNTFTPDWQSATPQATAREYIFDEREKTVFYLNPPIDAGGSITVIASMTPQPNLVVDATTQTTVNDEYRQPLIEYALYVLSSSDTEGTPNISRAQTHLNTFANVLGVSWQAVRGQSPKQVAYEK